MALLRKNLVFFINLFFGLIYLALCLFELMYPGSSLVHNLIFAFSFLFAIPALLIMFLTIGWGGWLISFLYIICIGYFLNLSWKKPRRILILSSYLIANTILFLLEVYVFFEHVFMGGIR
jgi:hypothetical protein